jgi:hypothetical protein
MTAKQYEQAESLVGKQLQDFFNPDGSINPYPQRSGVDSLSKRERRISKMGKQIGKLEDNAPDWFMKDRTRIPLENRSQEEIDLDYIRSLRDAVNPSKDPNSLQLPESRGPELSLFDENALDMSLEARIARARELGYDVDNIYFHGSPYNSIDEFNTYGSNYGLFGLGSYFTDNPGVASSYTSKGIKKLLREGKTPAETVYPVYLRLKDPIDMDAPADLNRWKDVLNKYEIDPSRFNKNTKNEDLYRVIEEELIDRGYSKDDGAETMQGLLQSMGHDGITHIGGGRVNADDVRHKVRIAFDPENIRSVNAAFDPAKTNSGNILAGAAGAGIASQMIPEDEEDKFSNIRKTMRSKK